MNSERTVVHGTADQLPRFSQSLKLICQQCGTRAVYDVGIILHDVEGEGGSAKKHYSFSNYFRCKN
jgi:hypothetical protein